MVYSPFPAVVTALIFSQCAWWKNNLYLAHILRSVDCRIHSLISSLKITICGSRVIPFDIITVSEIFWPPALANYPPFSNCLISRARGSAGLYGPIIFTAFSSGSISSIALYLENRCCSMVSAYTCLKPVSWSNSGDRKTGSTAVTICFSSLHPRQCIFETSLSFVGTFQFRALVLGSSPCSMGSHLGCVATQTRILSVLCTLGTSLSAQGVYVWLLQGSTPRTPHSHLSIDVSWSILLFLVIRQYLEW